jgi:hypothetical protein
MDILQKMKNIFTGKKNDNQVIDFSNKLLEIIKNSGISNENLSLITKNGTRSNELKQSLKKIFFFKDHQINKAVIELSDISSIFQVAKVLNLKNILFLTNPSFNLEKYTFKTKIKATIGNLSDDFKGLVVCEKGKINEFNFTKIGLTKNFEKYDYCFLQINDQNFGSTINDSIEINEKIIGFASSKSVLDAHRFGLNQLINNLCKISKPKLKVQINEMELMQKFQGGQNISVNFNEILFTLEKMEELSKTNVLASFGMKITPEMIKGLKKQESIINSMTIKERSNPSIIEQQRIYRIAKGSGATTQEVEKLISMINMIKQQGGKFAANMMNPAAMSNMLNNKN